MTERFDVIVVGGRCAGSPLATFLARAGLSVCVVDRARFPSETPSTHGIQPTGVKVLERLGLFERLARLTTPVDHGTGAFEDARVELHGVTEQLGAPMLNIRRVTLDAILLEAAAAAGAEIRTETAVTGVIEEDGRVVGVATRSGALRAPLVVGADGYRSTVARAVGAAEYHETPAGRIFMWAYFEDAKLGDGHAWLGKIGDTAFLGSPTDGGLFMAAACPSAERRDEVFADREGVFTAALAGWPELDAVVDGAKRVGPVRVMSGWHGYFRESAGPGWVLLGDAGHFKDPTPGQGISDALRQAVELADAIERALGGAASLDDVLHDWWSWRDRDAWQMYWLARDLGASGPTPLLLQAMQRRIAADPDLAKDLLSLLNHDLPPSKLFTPPLVLAVASKAFLRNPGRRRLLLREARALVAEELRHLRVPRPRARVP